MNISLLRRAAVILLVALVVSPSIAAFFITDPFGHSTTFNSSNYEVAVFFGLIINIPSVLLSGALFLLGMGFTSTKEKLAFSFLSLCVIISVLGIVRMMLISMNII